MASIVAGYLPLEAQEYLGARLPYVYLSRWSLDKIFKKHADLSDFDLLAVQHLLNTGKIVTDPEERVVVACGCVGDPARLYKAAVKLAGSNCDAWLTGFYRTDQRHLRSVLRKGRLLREGTGLNGDGHPKVPV